MKRIDTICRDCVFALFDLDDVQDGCALGRLGPLEANGGELVPEKGEDSTYYRIRGRFCTSVRNHEWAARQQDQSAEGLMAAVEADARVKPLAIVYAGPDSTDEQLEASIASLKRQSFAMKHLTLCFCGEFGRAERWVARLQVEHPGCTWGVLNGEEPSEPQLEQYGDDPYLRLVDEAVLDSKLVHYTAARAGFEWPPSLFEAFSRATHVEMKMYAALLPAPNADPEGYLTSRALHEKLYENKFDPLVDKIMAVAEAEGMENTVAFWEDLGL